MIPKIYKAKLATGKKCRSLTSSCLPCIVLAIQSQLSEVYIHLQHVLPKIIPHCLPDPIMSITLSPSVQTMILNLCFGKKTLI